jgi:hypothetical protein
LANNPKNKVLGKINRLLISDGLDTINLDYRLIFPNTLFFGLLAKAYSLILTNNPKNKVLGENQSMRN